MASVIDWPLLVTTTLHIANGIFGCHLEIVCVCVPMCVCICSCVPMCVLTPDHNNRCHKTGHLCGRAGMLCIVLGGFDRSQVDRSRVMSLTNGSSNTLRRA